MAGGNGTGKSGGAATASRAGSVVVPDGVTLETVGEFRDYTANVNGNRLVFSVGSPGVRGADVSFDVNGRFTRGSFAPSGADGRAIALRVRSIMRADAASRPDGFRYVTSAATGDGLGPARARLYSLAGFSSASSPGAAQFATVRGGSIARTRGRA